MEGGTEGPYCPHLPISKAGVSAASPRPGTEPALPRAHTKFCVGALAHVAPGRRNEKNQTSRFGCKASRVESGKERGDDTGARLGEKERQTLTDSKSRT